MKQSLFVGPLRYNRAHGIHAGRAALRAHSGVGSGALNDQVPEDVREYWVEIDGVRWPVKQVISLATGVTNRRRFQSQDSRRWLQNLGFRIGQGGSSHAGTGAPRSRAAPPPTARHQRARAAGVHRGDVVVHVAPRWVAISRRRGPAVIPGPAAGAGLYRFDFGLDDEGVRTIYIGESVSLRQRASNYRNAKTDRSRQRTSRRIHKEVVAHLNAGGAIEFAIATAVVPG